MPCRECDGTGLIHRLRPSPAGKAKPVRISLSLIEVEVQSISVGADLLLAAAHMKKDFPFPWEALGPARVHPSQEDTYSSPDCKPASSALRTSASLPQKPFSAAMAAAGSSITRKSVCDRMHGT